MDPQPGIRFYDYGKIRSREAQTSLERVRPFRKD